MKGFIVDSTYINKDEKTYVLLYGRLENKQSFCTINQIEPYFFIEEKHLKKAEPFLLKYKVEKTKDRNFQGENVIKIISQNSTDQNKISEFLKRKSIAVYEADIKPHFRFMIDRSLKGFIEIDGDYDASERMDRIYTEPKISSAESKHIPLKIASIDIESHTSGDPLFCIGIYTEKTKENFIISSKKVKNAISCKNEEECLEKFKKRMIELDPDIITGWNVIDFDFQYLKKKYDKYKIPFDIGRDGSNLKLRIESDFFRSSSATIVGRQVLDGLNLIKDPFIKEAPTIKNANFETLSLEDVSQSLLGEGKKIKGKNRHLEIDEWYKKDQEKLVEYNLQDCKLVYDLMEKTKIIELAMERSALTGMPLDRITASIASFDSVYISEARKKGLVSPTTHYQEKKERIKGGYVMESNAGIYHNVLVLDFKSLYPSIIKTFNIDPASYVEKKEKNVIVAPNGAMFKNQDGVLPEIITKLHEAREKAKKEKRELSSYAIKIIMNSFFGVLASPTCRYFSLEIANAITHFGQMIIQLTAKKIEEMKYKVIYSDTDSVFVETNSSKDEANKIGKKIEEEINNFYKKYVKEKYNRTSYLELQFQKQYLSFLLPKIRDSELGSKKRYAGLIDKNGKEELDIVGLEAIRGDWTEAAQEFQKELLNLIFHKKEVIPFIKDYVKKIESGKMDDKLIYTKSITKPLSEYTKTTPPHVKAARQLGHLSSNVIQYYITTEGPEPIQKKKHSLNYEHYIKKQIQPIADTILYFFKTSFEDVLKSSKQTKLF